VRDEVPRNPQVVCKTIRFLASGYLTPLEEVDREGKGTWDDLVELYNFSKALSIKTLEVAMLSEFSKLLDSLDPAVFLAFARRYYKRNDKDQNKSLERLIKVKLADFLPRLQQTMSVKAISTEGGVLGRQLIEVLLEDRVD
jgi:hypothetical protein